MKSRRQFLIKTPAGLLAASGPAVTPTTFAEAEKLMQVSMTQAEREVAGASAPLAQAKDRFLRSHQSSVALPASDEDIAFAPVTQLSRWIETDRLWNTIVNNGGQESACGWCKDKWGLSWQITPRALIEALADPDPAAAKRVFDAMMQMGKINIAALEAARRG